MCSGPSASLGRWRTPARWCTRPGAAASRRPSIWRPGLEVTFLKPVRADGGRFARLVTLDGAAVTEAHRQRRRDTLLALLERLRPDAVITEASQITPSNPPPCDLDLDGALRSARLLLGA